MHTQRKLQMSAFNIGAAAMLGAIALVLAALGFEHIGGYVPCELCLLQRVPYYAVIPLLFVTLPLLTAGHARAAASLFLLASMLFLATAGIGAYQAGAEWQFWPGPTSCSGEQPIAQQAGGLLDALKTTTVVRCDVAQLRILGLSFAGWNVVAGLILFAMATQAAFRAAPGEQD